MTIVAQWIASLAVPVSMLVVRPVFAHTDAPTWVSGAEPWLAVILVIALVLYARGLYRLHAAATNLENVRRHAFCFALGWAAIAIALISPLALEGAGIYTPLTCCSTSF